MQEVAETIFNIVRVLPERKQREVLDFVSDLSKEKTDGLADFAEFVETSRRSVPDEDWDDLPTDGSANHDHYLYGARKRY